MLLSNYDAEQVDFQTLKINALIIYALKIFLNIYYFNDLKTSNLMRLPPS